MGDSAETVIVGGGIAGLAVAIALRQRGVETVVLEQASELREIGAGFLLGPNGCAVLERLGALAGLRAGHSVSVPRWELRDMKGRLLSALTIPRDGEHSLSTRRSDLQAALLACLPRETVLPGCEVIRGSFASGGVTLTLADGREWLARRVIIADGAHSKIRASFWPGREPHYLGYIGWRGLVDHVPAGWEGGRVCESWGHGRRFGIAPVGGGRTYWYASANVAGPNCRDRVGIDQLREDFAGWHAPVAEILDTMPDAELLQHPISDLIPPRSWQIEEKVVLIGDAAHPLSPNLGQGASMALEDAWELALQWGRPDAMAQFERKRRWRLRKLWALSRWLGTMIQWENPLLCRGRDVQMRVMPDAVATAMMRRFLRHEPGYTA
ncbi:FAD-dependent monooxygenase [Luteolibacter soli]|uniref:FAD-dependent monooxygenase n=1 Tax=Luteolibacter soli TaxID=3135280 RepID=A0ABU9B1F0_9BACT